MRSTRAPLLVAVTLFALILASGGADATFSIVAVDLATGEVGGAGASCIANSFIINDLIEGVGAIHTQALWNGCNQTRARDRMLAGDSPDQIIAYIQTNDCNGPGCGVNPCTEAHRQYIVVDFDPAGGPGRGAGHTGASTFFFANDIAGPDYAIAGNILIDPATFDVIAKMEQAFVNTTGTLAERLMAAMQGANFPSADSRCSGRPAQSAFVKVVKPGGDPAAPYLELNVGNTASTENPIDILQMWYDVEPEPFFSSVDISGDRLRSNGKDQATITVTPRNFGNVAIGPGLIVVVTNSGGGVVGPLTDNLDGTYTATLTSAVARGTDTITVTVDGNAGPVTLATQPLVTYFKPKKGGGGGGCALIAPPGADLLTKIGGLLPFALLLLVVLVAPLRRRRAAFSGR